MQCGVLSKFSDHLLLLSMYNNRIVNMFVWPVARGVAYLDGRAGPRRLGVAAGRASQSVILACFCYCPTSLYPNCS